MYRFAGDIVMLGILSLNGAIHTDHGYIFSHLIYFKKKIFGVTG